MTADTGLLLKRGTGTRETAQRPLKGASTPSLEASIPSTIDQDAHRSQPSRHPFSRVLPKTYIQSPRIIEKFGNPVDIWNFSTTIFLTCRLSSRLRPP